MTIIVFLGPSVPVEQARAALPEARLLPPCAMGDVYAAVERYKPAAIGIIDGYFERTPAVWHKEILFALSRGIAVFGASSMGALRAAELAPFGMRGVGEVYEAYAGGAIEDDDEVAVSHLPAEAGYRLLSEPMVNIRYAMKLALEADLVEPGEAEALCEEAKRRYYPDRSWEALWEGPAAAALTAARRDALRAFVETRRPDVKREDGLALLEELARWQRAPAPFVPDFAFEPTIFWEHLCAYRARDESGGGAVIERERLLDHVKLAEPQREALLDDALLLHLAEREAARLGLSPPDDRTALARFRRDRGLQSAAALQRWMREQHLGADGCLALARAEAVRRALRWRFAEAVDAQLPEALRRRGRYGIAMAEVADKWDRVGAAAGASPDAATIDAALAWYQRVQGPVRTSIEEHFVELGFGSAQQFTSELVATYLAHLDQTGEAADAA